jgi:hypothetical protein
VQKSEALLKAAQVFFKVSPSPSAPQTTKKRPQTFKKNHSKQAHQKSHHQIARRKILNKSGSALPAHILTSKHTWSTSTPASGHRYAFADAWRKMRTQGWLQQSEQKGALEGRRLGFALISACLQNSHSGLTRRPGRIFWNFNF